MAHIMDSNGTQRQFIDSKQGFRYHSSTHMLKSVASDFWKPLIQTNMSKILENIEETDDETNDMLDQ